MLIGFIPFPLFVLIDWEINSVIERREEDIKMNVVI